MIQQQEKASKRLNIIVRKHGWKEPNLKFQAEKFFSDKFDLHNAINNVTKISRESDTLRIGLVNEEIKEKIMGEKSLVLKDISISFNHDLTRRELYCIKKLKEASRNFIESGKPVKIKGNHLWVGNTCYSWDLESNGIKQSVARNTKAGRQTLRISNTAPKN